MEPLTEGGKASFIHDRSEPTSIDWWRCRATSGPILGRSMRSGSLLVRLRAYIFDHHVAEFVKLVLPRIGEISAIISVVRSKIMLITFLS